MSLQPNLKGGARVFYVGAGVGLVAWGLFFADLAWARVVLLVAGGLAITEGIIAFCPTVWLLGRGRK